MWAEDLISRALGSGKVTRVVLSDAKVMILRFESHCVSKNALTSGCVWKSVSTSGAIRVRRLFCSGSAAVAAGQSIRRPPGAARGKALGNGSRKEWLGRLGKGFWGLGAAEGHRPHVLHGDPQKPMKTAGFCEGGAPVRSSDPFLCFRNLNWTRRVPKCKFRFSK